MRKLFLTAAVVGLTLSACKSTKEESVLNAETESQETVAEQPEAKSSIDFIGSYKGVLPCADCEGIETLITLNPDESFSIKQTYLGKEDKPFEEIGSYEWMEDGNRLMFEDTESNITYYLVTDGKLTMLDSEGNPVEGPNAANYELNKQ